MKNIIKRIVIFVFAIVLITNCGIINANAETISFPKKQYGRTFAVTVTKSKVAAHEKRLTSIYSHKKIKGDSRLETSLNWTRGSTASVSASTELETGVGIIAELKVKVGVTVGYSVTENEGITVCVYRDDASGDYALESFTPGNKINIKIYDEKAKMTVTNQTINYMPKVNSLKIQKWYRKA